MTKFRLYMISFFFMAAFGVVVFRAVRLQLFPHPQVENLARRQLEHKVEVVSRRGSVLDRNGRELAISINSLSLFANPRLVTEPAKVARTLAPIVGVSTTSLMQKITQAKTRKFIWLARQLNQKQMKDLENIELKNLDGVGVLPEFRREFPQHSLASQILGFVSIDGVGIEGVEKHFQTKLVGERESVLLSKDAWGRPVFTHRDQIRMELDKGSDVELTIDSRLQYSLEKILKDTIDEHGAELGSAIVMDPHTGEILAMGSVPSFDSNDPSSFPMEARRNRVITDPFEPGSVLKPFVVARALEDKVVGMNSRIPTYGGKITVGRKVITEAEEKHRFESVSIVDLIRLSSNVGSVVLGQKLGWSKIEDTYRSLGFGAQTGIDLAGESRGIFNSPRANQLLEKATMTFGQGISLTMLQVAQAYAVIANGGVRVRPHILRSVHGPGDLDLNAPLSIAGTRVFTAQTTEKMKAILEKVVENEGTGILAKVDGFRVAGKTGTSQKVDYKLGGYEKAAYWSQFTGFIPSDKPKYVISVMIDSPRKKGYYGGVVAAPAFSKIAQAAIRLGQNETPFVLSSSKDTKSTTKEEHTKKSATQKLVTNKEAKTNKKVANLSDSQWQSVPTVVGLPLTDALRIMQQKGFSTEIENSGTQVEAQSLEAGTQAEAGQKISLRLR